MYLNQKKLLLIAFAVINIFTAYKTYAQQAINLVQAEDSLQNMFLDLSQTRDDSVRIELNKKIDDFMGIILKEKETFTYPFDSLKFMSKLTSSDGLVRIYNWNIPFENGEFTYFAYIQHFDKKKNLMLFRLQDKSINIQNPEYKELNDKNWYGALYYKIINTKDSKHTYYTLLGWDGNDNFTNKKLIESFVFEGKRIIFGPPVFKSDKEIKNRLIFEYAEQAKMMLRYEEELKMIVFDHLAPAQKKFEGQFMYYGPDMSHDGILFKDGIWELKQNLNLRNMDAPTGKSIEKSY